MMINRDCLVSSFHRIGESIVIQTALLTGVLGASFLLPTEGVGVTTCLWHELFHFDCPACGLTRSFIAMSSGSIKTAFQFHWLGPFLYAVTIAVAVDRTLQLCSQGRRRIRALHRVKDPFGWVLGGLISTWLVRLLLTA